MRCCPFLFTRGRASARPALKGFSTLEVAIAFSILLLVATGVLIATTSVQKASLSVRVQHQTRAVLDRAVHAVADQPYATLTTDTFAVPDQCATNEAGDVGSGATSCYSVAGIDVVATWQSQPVVDGEGTNGTQVTASAVLPDGTSVQSSAVRVAPHAGYQAGTGQLRVRVWPSTFNGTVHLLDETNGSVDAVAVTSGWAVLTDDTGTCTSAQPCHLGLASGAGFLTSNGWSVANHHSGAVASQLVLPPGLLHEATLILQEQG